jgi:hypothetical protein
MKTILKLHLKNKTEDLKEKPLRFEMTGGT